MKNKLGEKKRIEKVAEKVLYADGFNGQLMYYRYLTLKEYFHGRSALELGCADGHMTQYLVKNFRQVVAVDGSETYCSITRKSVVSENLQVVCAMFEEYNPSERFDTIIMAHILEHVFDPVQLLKLAKKWLKPGGCILIDVPNADSLHRYAGVFMKSLKKVTDLNTLDRKLGHRRVYSWQTLLRDIKLAGLRTKHIGGVFLKPLTNSQIDQWWDKKMKDAFFELGKKFPEIAAEIFAVCVLP